MRKIITTHTHNTGYVSLSHNTNTSYQGWQNGSGPSGRPASPSVNTWAGSRNSARQPETARPVKPAGPSGQPAGQNRPARGPYHLIKKQHVHIFSVFLPHTHFAPRHLTHSVIASLLLDSSLRSLLLHPRRSGSISTSQRSGSIAGLFVL